MSYKWYLVYTRPNEEQKVNARLGDYTTFYPYTVEQVRTSQKGRTRPLQRALYPRYLFCQAKEQDLHNIIGTVGVSDLVRMEGEPITVRDEEVERIRRQALPSGEVLMGKKRSLRYKKGQKVTVKDEYNALFGLNLLTIEVNGDIMRAEIIGSGLKAMIPVHSVELSSK